MPSTEILVIIQANSVKNKKKTHIIMRLAGLRSGENAKLSNDMANTPTWAKQINIHNEIRRNCEINVPTACLDPFFTNSTMLEAGCCKITSRSCFL